MKSKLMKSNSNEIKSNEIKSNDQFLNLYSHICTLHTNMSSPFSSKCTQCGSSVIIEENDLAMEVCAGCGAVRSESQLLINDPIPNQSTNTSSTSKSSSGIASQPSSYVHANGFYSNQGDQMGKKPGKERRQIKYWGMLRDLIVRLHLNTEQGRKARFYFGKMFSTWVNKKLLAVLCCLVVMGNSSKVGGSETGVGLDCVPMRDLVHDLCENVIRMRPGTLLKKRAEFAREIGMAVAGRTCVDYGTYACEVLQAKRLGLGRDGRGGADVAALRDVIKYVVRGIMTCCRLWDDLGGSGIRGVMVCFVWVNWIRGLAQRKFDCDDHVGKFLDDYVDTLKSEWKLKKIRPQTEAKMRQFIAECSDCVTVLCERRRNVMDLLEVVIANEKAVIGLVRYHRKATGSGCSADDDHDYKHSGVMDEDEDGNEEITAEEIETYIRSTEEIKRLEEVHGSVY